MKEYKASFYREPNLREIGPQLEEHVIASNSKTQAIKTAKQAAKFHDWRFLEVTQLNNENQWKVK